MSEQENTISLPAVMRKQCEIDTRLKKVEDALRSDSPVSENENDIEVDRDLFDASRDGFLAGMRHAFKEGPSKSGAEMIAARGYAADYVDERARMDELTEKINALQRRYDELTNRPASTGGERDENSGRTDADTREGSERVSGPPARLTRLSVPEGAVPVEVYEGPGVGEVTVAIGDWTIIDRETGFVPDLAPAKGYLIPEHRSALPRNRDGGDDG